MDFIDQKFINLVSVRLLKFKQVKSNLYNFRCPICGDSVKNKTKARGYIYAVKNNTNYKCHNCGISISFNNFLKKIDPSLYKNYTLEKFIENKTGKNFVVEAPKFKFLAPKFKTKLDLPKASENEESKKYLEARKLNPDHFFYAEKFKEWTNSKIKIFEKIEKDEPRIIIPLFYNKHLIGFQGRKIGGNELCKYITIMLDENQPKIYGLDNVDKNQNIYVVEGPFDSTFIKNSIAMCGADIDLGPFNWRNIVYVYDNEPRNREIVARIKKRIANGDQIVIWPSNVEEKDINAMVLAGHDAQSVIESNTYKNLEATLKFNYWKKI